MQAVLVLLGLLSHLILKSSASIENLSKANQRLQSSANAFQNVLSVQNQPELVDFVQATSSSLAQITRLLEEMHPELSSLGSQVVTHDIQPPSKTAPATLALGSQVGPPEQHPSRKDVSARKLSQFSMTSGILMKLGSVLAFGDVGLFGVNGQGELEMQFDQILLTGDLQLAGDSCVI